jgi:hypothetical protein
MGRFLRAKRWPAARKQPRVADQPLARGPSAVKTHRPCKPSAVSRGCCTGALAMLTAREAKHRHGEADVSAEGGLRGSNGGCRGTASLQMIPGIQQPRNDDGPAGSRKRRCGRTRTTRKEPPTKLGHRASSGVCRGHPAGRPGPTRRRLSAQRGGWLPFVHEFRRIASSGSDGVSWKVGRPLVACLDSTIPIGLSALLRWRARPASLSRGCVE